MRLERLKPLLTSGAASIAVGMAGTNLIRIVSTLVLTRLLDPSAYGVAGILMSVATAMALLTDIGTGPFIVRHKEGDDQQFRDAIWTLRLVRSIALTLATAMLAAPIAQFMEKPFIAPVLTVFSLIFLIDGVSSLGFATAIRERQLWRLSMLDLATVAVQLLAAIPLAWFWPSYWVIPITMLAGAGFKAAMSYPVFPGAGRRLRMDRVRAVELWEFARFIAPSSLLTLLIMQADKVFLARVMSLSDFGHYSIAVTLAAVPAAAAHPYAFRVLFPAYSQAVHAGGDALRRIFYAKRRKIALLYMFLTGGFIGGAPFAIELLYDDRYREVTPILQVLLVSSALALVNWSADQALMALGKLRATLLANVVRVAWLIVAGVGGYLALGSWGLILALGGMEVAGMACYWISLSRNGLLRLGEEALGFAAIGLGFAVAIPLNALLLMLLR